MSRIGKKPVEIAGGVTVTVNGKSVNVKGSLGSLDWTLPEQISATVEGNEVRVERANDQKQSKALHGLSRALINNMVVGVSKGYQQRLEVYGTGYSCGVKGKFLELNCGFMGRGTKDKAQFSIPIPDGVEVTVETPAARGDSDPAKFLVKGCDKQVVGHFAASVRKIRPPEPYKGKGIRFEGEHVRRKQGKALAGGR